MALRFFTPDGVDRTNLEWIYYGYADDTPEMRQRRLRHLNLGGSADFVSMGGRLRRRVRGARHRNGRERSGHCRDGAHGS
jgi:hypothetical protein